MKNKASMIKYKLATVRSNCGIAVTEFTATPTIAKNAQNATSLGDINLIICIHL